ncbi:peptidase M49, dipeptidyl-peptidase III [Lophiostoma macrostomum CBS 122681]|uniref:Peptidase M49, dipeptidyl-peptidase III n=1 Tax=Lophiostoma macrostomum CBS 122681 TaxID=1314788 RepID=A0A6A6T972_9PLEO|nr:peptidase M49, dipeptidyl-peptidase III [Lophiostoma macrostomum CBS 122681]
MAPQELLADIDPPVFALSARSAFEQLSPKEKLYAHHMSRAAYNGARILLNQVSPESETIVDMIFALYGFCNGEWFIFANQCAIGAAEMDRFLDYAAMVLDSLGNYRGYGDRKIIPRISRERLDQLCVRCEEASALFKKVSAAIFCPTPERLGYPDQGGMSSYFPGSLLSKSEITEVSDALLKRGFYLENTSLRKTQAGEDCIYEVLVSSVETGAPTDLDGCFQLEGSHRWVRLVYGHFAAELAEVSASLSKAAHYARNEHQRRYVLELVNYVRRGSVDSQKEASVAWLKDVAPPVETFTGFMECYRDPSSFRCEWEGLVALQNNEQTKAFDEMAGHALDLIKELPWVGVNGGFGDNTLGPFEHERFSRPDFVSLEVLTFCVSNCWTGITGPNFDDIEAAYGLKNIYLSNRAAAVNLNDQVPFIRNEDLAEYKTIRRISFTAIVAVHELIGHACGKLLKETESGEFNFDINDPPISPLSHVAIDTWYKIGQSERSVFGDIYTAFDECLAESVALLLIAHESVQYMVATVEGRRVTVEYHAYLQIISLGLRALLSYDPSTKKWNQSHDRARFAILKTLFEDGDGLLEIEFSTTESGGPDLEISLAKTLVPSVGRRVVESLLLHLQIYRCTADAEHGRPFFEKLTAVDGVFQQFREAVVHHQQYRPLFVQANTVLQEGVVTLIEYPATKEGIIKSWVERGIDTTTDLF